MNDNKQPDSIPEILFGHKSVFATLDEQGIPVHFQHCMDWSRKPDMDRAFAKYVQQEVVTNVFRVAVPDYRLCRFDFDDDVPLHRLYANNGDLLSLNRFVTEYGGKLTEEYPLIAAELVLFCLGKEPLVFDMETLRRGYDTEYPDEELKGKIEGYIETHRKYLAENQAQLNGVIIDTTSRGSIITENTGYGVKRSVRYLQYLADHYFDPECKDIVHYIQRVIPGCSQKLYNMALESRKAFSLSDFSLIPNRLLYQHPDIGQEPKPTIFRQVSMSKNSDAFRSFIDFTQVKVSTRNKDIYSLLSIAEKGYVPDNYAFSRMVQKQFRDAQVKIVTLTAEGNEHSQRLRDVREQAREKAVKVLKEKFNVDVEPCIPASSQRQKNVKPRLKK